jgi:phosphoribosylanthranilate isomerase
MRVKICGITSYEDAMLAIDAGADALGFIFYEKSPRYVSVEKATEIIDQLPPFIEKVGLFVNETAQTINATVKQAGITLIQLHFETDTSLRTALNYPYIQVIRAQSAQEISKLDPSHYYLVDAYCESYGGSGKRLNLEWFKDRDCSHIILAGGLTPDNLSELKSYGFYGVDVSSGTESEPGKKDPKKVRDFVNHAKS